MEMDEILLVKLKQDGNEMEIFQLLEILNEGMGWLILESNEMMEVDLEVMVAVQPEQLRQDGNVMGVLQVSEIWSEEMEFEILESNEMMEIELEEMAVAQLEQ